MFSKENIHFPKYENEKIPCAINSITCIHCKYIHLGHYNNAYSCDKNFFDIGITTWIFTISKCIWLKMSHPYMNIYVSS